MSCPSRHKSQTIARLQSSNLKGRIFSNDPWAVYILTGHNAEMPPRKPGPYDPPEWHDESKSQIECFKSTLESGQRVYLVWLLPNFLSLVHKPDQIQSFSEIKIVKKLKDGYVFALYPKDPQKK